MLLFLVKYFTHAFSGGSSGGGGCLIAADGSESATGQYPNFITKPRNAFSCRSADSICRHCARLVRSRPCCLQCLQQASFATNARANSKSAFSAQEILTLCQCMLNFGPSPLRLRQSCRLRGDSAFFTAISPPLPCHRRRVSRRRSCRRSLAKRKCACAKSCAAAAGSSHRPFEVDPAPALRPIIDLCNCCSCS